VFNKLLLFIYSLYRHSVNPIQHSATETAVVCVHIALHNCYTQCSAEHSPTHTYCGHQSPLICFIHLYDLWHPPCSICAPDSLFPQSLSKFSLVYLLAWYPPLHTPFIYSPNHCLLFATHARTITTCFAVVPRLCRLILVSLPTLYLELYHVASPHTSI